MFGNVCSSRVPKSGTCQDAVLSSHLVHPCEAISLLQLITMIACGKMPGLKQQKSSNL